MIFLIMSQSKQLKMLAMLIGNLIICGEADADGNETSLAEEDIIHNTSAAELVAEENYKK